MSFRFDDISINTIIGSQSEVFGNLSVAGSIRIEGDVHGTVSSDGNVQVGENARIKGNLSAKSAIIGGIVAGDIIAKEGVRLLSHAIVIGDVIAKKVQIDDNVIFHGHCISLHDETEFENASEKYLQAKAIRSKVAFA